MSAVPAAAVSFVPRIIVTIDTEEEGLWSGRFESHGATAANVQRVMPFQRICEDLGVAPTYLVNSPVVEDPAAVALLRPLQERERAEIGTHIHPWNTAPEAGGYDARSSYLCNLPLDLQRLKLETVTHQIESAFGRRPTSFRAGRYGLDGAGAALLADLGYMVDSSVCPFTDYSADGGPDFRGAPCHPYWAGADLRRPAATGRLLEVPVAFGFNRRAFALAERLHGTFAAPPWRRLRLNGILDRTGVLQKVKFSPEKGDSGRLLGLARAWAGLGLPALVMMFHSSSLLPGATPYVRNEAELARFLDTIRQVLLTCLGELGMVPATLTAFARDYSAAPAARYTLTS